MSYHEISELGSSVGIVDRLPAGQSRKQGWIPARKQDIFLFTAHAPCLGPSQFPHPVDKGSSFSGVKWAGRDANFSLRSIAEGREGLEV